MECKKKAGLISRPGQGGGAKLKLTQEQREQFQAKLRGQDFWSLPEVMHCLEEYYQVRYSSVHVRHLLKSWGMYHYKPQPQDYRRSEQAEEKLAERLRATADVLELWQCPCSEIAFGFADESSPEVNSNQARWWSFYKQPRKVNANKSLRYNTFGYYALQGQSVIQEIADSKAERLLTCLEKIRRANPTARYCVVVWDNLPAHQVADVQKKAREHHIILVNLPPYSPDLNPIEKIWKQIKRIISLQGLIKSKERLASIITESFLQLTASLSFALKWVQDFFLPIFKNYPIPK
ncbi:MAG: IS630 family transposase [Bacteroidota bacterium]|nr:IS630 family transposase [Bacteroidota bacterium]